MFSYKSRIQKNRNGSAFYGAGQAAGMYCKSSGPWGATLKKTGDSCTATITYELTFTDNNETWSNALASVPDGIQIVGGSNAIDFSIPGCRNCGLISDCNGNGSGHDNPWDIGDGI